MYKILIADDEILIREGIERVVRQHCPFFEDIYTAKDGDEALALAMNVVPDIVITDIQMPRVNGLEFIELLRCENPDVIVLVISGYDDFEYAKRGLKLGIKDYLLKPVETKELIDWLNQAVNEINRKYIFKRSMEELHEQIAQSQSLFRERFYRQLVSGVLDSQEIEEQMRTLGFRLQADYYCVSLVKINKMGTWKQQEMEVMALAMAEDLKERNTQIQVEMHPFYMTDDYMVIVMGYVGVTKDHAFKALDQYLMQLGHTLQKTANVDVKISAGQLYAALQEINNSYQEAMEAMLYHFSMNSRVVVHYQEISTSIAPNTFRSIPLHEELLLQVKLSDREKAIHVLDTIFQDFTSLPGANPN